jgi:hypothetical protein
MVLDLAVSIFELNALVYDVGNSPFSTLTTVQRKHCAALPQRRD